MPRDPGSPSDDAGTPSHDPGPSPEHPGRPLGEFDELLDREPELALLGRVVGRVCSGEGRRLLVLGPAGIGKSSLLRALTTLGARQGMRVLAAEGRVGERELAFALTRRLLHDVAGQERPAEPQAAAARLAQTTLERSAAAPLLIAVDDTHLADRATLRWLDLLAARLGDAPILLALAVRSGAGHPADAAWQRLLDERRAVVLRPAPLPAPGAARVLGARLGHAPSPPLLDACLQQTQGNPFLLGVLGEAIRQAGAAALPDPQTWIAELGSHALSQTIAARLGELSAEARTLVETVSVVGEIGGLSELATLTELPRSVLADAAAGLVSNGLLSSARTLQPAHPLVHEAIRASVPAARRERLQRAAVGLLIAAGRVEEAAGRLLQLPPRGEQQAVAILREAAAAASAHGAPETAAALLRRALAEPPEQALLGVVKAQLGQALLALGDPDAAPVLAEALELAPDAAGRAASARRLSLALVYALRIGEACDVLGTTARELEASHPALSEELHAEMLRIMIFDPALQQRRATLVRALPGERGASELAHRMRLVELAVQSAGACAPAARTTALAERALAGGVLVSRAPGSHASAVVQRIQHGRTDIARTVLGAAVAIARERGENVALARTFSLLGEAQRRDGDVAGAHADLRTAIELVGGRQPGPPYMLAGLLEALVERNELAATDAELRRAGLAGELPDVLTRGLLLHARAVVRLAGGMVQLALEDLMLAGEDLRRFGCDTPAAVPWRGTAAEALVALGELEQARKLSGEQLALAERIGAAEVLGPALRIHARALGGARGTALLERSVDLLAGSRARLEHARALTDLALDLREQDRGRAHELLRRAAVQAEELGAVALSGRVTAALLAVGARPRRGARGTGALTPAERRVVELAAHGLSNREIAETLVVTTKTVETHLAAAFRKLGVRSRGQLAAVLAGATGVAAAGIRGRAAGDSQGKSPGVSG